MVAQARLEPAAAAVQYPARSTREEAAQAPALPAEQEQVLAQVSARAPSVQRRRLAPRLAQEPAAAAEVSPAWPAESASWKKPSCIACSGCSPSSVKLNRPKILISTHCPGG